MASIHLLPTRRASPDQMMRLSADLIDARERGVDLGSRATHIQAGGETLLQLGHQLEDALENMRRTLGELGLRDHSMETVLWRLLGEIQRLAACAQNFPIDS